MGDVAIKVEGLGKRYALGAEAPYATLRESLGNLVRLRRRAAKPTMWAVNNVSFSVNQGETVGIIGRNGAGKSTLLKMLSRITTPTSGRIEVTGRLASLLEVGTGFHPELTGRENVFLNGGILGMTRPEIRARFDEIVAFAEVEKFIDTAVKHYSSGMYLRLAFAVAAHLEPEILIVDEVLAVGDASFQRKCLAKMEDVGSHGRTVLFVSHSMQAISRLCSRTVLLDRGAILGDGPTLSVISKYLTGGQGTAAQREWTREEAPGDDTVRLLAVRTVNGHGATVETFQLVDPVTIQVDYLVLQQAGAPTANIHVYAEDGACAFVSVDNTAPDGLAKSPGFYRSTVIIPGNLLNEGSYSVLTAVSTMDPVRVHVAERDAVSFQVVEGEGSTTRAGYGGPMPGAFRPLLRWFTERLSDRPTPPQTGADQPTKRRRQIQDPGA